LPLSECKIVEQIVSIVYFVIIYSFLIDEYTMNTNKIMLISISFVLAAILLSSGNSLSLSFAQSNTTSQSNDGSEDQTNNGTENNNSDSQNWDDFQICLEDEAGTTGYPTEEQIRDCFAPIYIGGDSNNDDSNNDDSNNDDSNNN
jgi:hypothetical protein